MKFTSTRLSFNPVIKFILAIILVGSTLFPTNRNILIFENQKKLNPISVISIDHSNEQAKLILEQKRIERIVAEKERLEKLALEARQTTKTVFLVNYYTNDSSGSGSVTASGLRTSDFRVNELGWYTYNGKVVVAAAMNYCLRLTTGICGQWNFLPTGWVAFDFYDEITIIHNGKEYVGVVLDLCGQCHIKSSYEQFQRIDIFIANNPFGKVLGQIRY